jgi:predicted Rossmann-fold nucleotide-binding protein
LSCQAVLARLLELAMIWQLLQVRKLHRTPLILIGRMWADFIEWGRQHLLRPDLALASREDLDIPHCVDTAQEAVSIIRPRYEEWLRGPA